MIHILFTRFFGNSKFLKRSDALSGFYQKTRCYLGINSKNVAYRDPVSVYYARKRRNWYNICLWIVILQRVPSKLFLSTLTPDLYIKPLRDYLCDCILSFGFVSIPLTTPSYTCHYSHSGLSGNIGIDVFLKELHLLSIWSFFKLKCSFILIMCMLRRLSIESLVFLQ